MQQLWTFISSNQKTSTPACRQWEAFQLEMDFENIMSLFWTGKCIFWGIQALKTIYVLYFFKDSNAIIESSALIVEVINFCSLELNIFNVTKVLETFSKAGWEHSQCPSSDQNKVSFFLSILGARTVVWGPAVTLKQPRQHCSSAGHGGAGWFLLEKTAWQEAVLYWNQWLLFLLFPSLYNLVEIKPLEEKSSLMV